MTSWIRDPFWRTSVGFDRLFDLMDASLRFEPQDHFPACNITRTAEDQYRITLALPGYKPDQIEVTAQQNVLTVAGRADNGAADDNREVLYRGIGTRAFERRFSLADYVEVTGASLQDGLLQIDLERRVPEAMKPRRIELKTGGAEIKRIGTDADRKAA